jgi:uncharacterized protein Veg
MNQNKIKNDVYKLVNEYHTFICRGCRNQNEIFSGRIIKCYNSIFIIELDNKEIKSFSYSDFGIKNIKIIS